MKRLFTFFVASMLVASVMAQHEIGVIAGGINGVSYKYWFSEKLAAQADLAVGLTAAPAGIYYQGYYFGGGTNPQYDFTLNPNLEYHFDLPYNLNLYAGGGLNLGLVSDIANTNPNSIFGKFGLNGIVGLAWLASDKLVLSFDFRPGYGLGFRDADTAHISFFDWKLGVAVRYRI